MDEQEEAEGSEPVLTLVEGQPEAAETRADGVTLDLSPLRLTLSPTKLILAWRLSLTNNSAGPIVALRIWSDLSTAPRGAITHDEAGRPDPDKARLHKVAILASGERVEFSGEWHMPRNAGHTIERGAGPQVLPIARFRLIGAGIRPTLVNFAVGTPQGQIGRLPAPLPVDDQLQIFPDLVATRLP